MSSVRRRLDKLTADTGNKPCEECGHGSGGPVTYEVEWIDGFDEDDTVETHCPKCNQQFTYIIRWPDEE